MAHYPLRHPLGISPSKDILTKAHTTDIISTLLSQESAEMEITETKLKEILAEQRSEFQHVVGIFKEDLESKIGLIAEQYEDIKSTQKSHTEMIGSLTEQYREIHTIQKAHTGMIGSLTEQYREIHTTQKAHTEMIGSLTEQYREIHTTQKAHTEMIGTLVEDVQIIKSDVQFLKRELKRKVDYDEFDALAKRVSLLEEKSRK
jgi:chromosome segregation ATPase